MTNTKELKIVWFLLRFGVAFTFLYASVNAFIHPGPWLTWFPDFIRDRASDQTLLMTWGLGELIIGIWILSGYRIFIPSVAASCFLLGVFIFDFHVMSVLFRNVSILSTSLSLAVMSNPYYKFYLSHEDGVAQESRVVREK